MTRPSTRRLLASRFSYEGRVCPETTAKQNFPTRLTEAQRQQSNGCQGPCSFSRGPFSCPDTDKPGPAVEVRSRLALCFCLPDPIHQTTPRTTQRGSREERDCQGRQSIASLLRPQFVNSRLLHILRPPAPMLTRTPQESRCTKRDLGVSLSAQHPARKCPWL